uniref:Isocitrate lyase n=1 Tax=Quercus lobata TaxID=97700 RepID=A0A7N2MQT5_QUELO
MNPTAVVSSRSYTYTYTYNPSLSFHTSPPHSPLSAFTFRLPFQPSLNTPLINPIHKSHTRFSKVCAAERYYGLSESPAKALRRVLELPGLHQGPACFDALSAKLVERAGFQYCFTSGFSISAARLGLPDTGFISSGEMVDQGQQITQAVSIPVIGDGDTGYGNAMNVKRTVKGYIRAGFAGIILEDQQSACHPVCYYSQLDSLCRISLTGTLGSHHAICKFTPLRLLLLINFHCKVSPKACGHTQGRKVVSREEAVMRIKAAIDARKESGSDIVIVARTDSRQAVSLDESLWRSRAFADVGADVLFIDALASKEEMKAFCEISPLVPKMANMLEGGGKTPILNPLELEDLGYKLVAYPLSLIGVSIQAMQDSLTAIKGGRIPPPGSMPSFEEIKEILGFNTYYEEEKRYATSTNQPSSQRVSSSRYSIQQRVQDYTEQRGRSPQDPIVEVITPDVYDNYGADGSRDPFSQIWSRTLRIKITGRDGFEKLDVRIPAGFLDGITNIIPALGGVNIKELLDDAADEVGGKLLLDFSDTMGDRIQVFLE